jgi:hypothetical protein
VSAPPGDRREGAEHGAALADADYLVRIAERLDTIREQPVDVAILQQRLRPCVAALSRARREGAAEALDRAINVFENAERAYPCNKSVTWADALDMLRRLRAALKEAEETRRVSP